MVSSTGIISGRLAGKVRSTGTRGKAHGAETGTAYVSDEITTHQGNEVEGEFASVGECCPGVDMRIGDSHGEECEEGTPGSLEVFGKVTKAEWAKAEAQKLKAFFARQEERQRSGGGAAELEWAYSTDGEQTHHARVPVGGLVKHVTLGLFGTVLQKGSGAEPGDGTCEAYWALHGQECAADVAGAQFFHAGRIFGSLPLDTPEEACKQNRGPAQQSG